MDKFSYFNLLAPALTACTMIALTHAPLGIEVLRRGIIFMDLAIAQFAGLGTVTATSLWQDPPSLVIQISALLFALTAAWAFRTAEQLVPDQQEAIIGTSFVVSASIALLLLSLRPHGGEEIEQLLSGQVLFVTWDDVAWHSPVYLTIIAAWFLFPRIVRVGGVFYLLFAVAITSSVQLVGVYVVFASLILPALAAVKSKSPIIIGWLTGIIAISTGIVFSTLYDLPAGPVLVVSYAAIAAIIIFVREVFKQRQDFRNPDSSV